MCCKANVNIFNHEKEEMHVESKVVNVRVFFRLFGVVANTIHNHILEFGEIASEFIADGIGFWCLKFPMR